MGLYLSRTQKRSRPLNLSLGTDPVDVITSPLYTLLSTLLQLYQWVIIISVIMSWLLQFGVIDGYNPIIRQIREALYRLTEPALRPIRNLLPDLGGIDISPIILIVVIYALQELLRKLLL